MTDEEQAKELLVKQLNEDIILKLKRHEFVKIAQVLHLRLDNTEQFDYERSIWVKLVDGSSELPMGAFGQWLLGRENDIAIGDADLGELREIFKAVFGREATEVE